MQHNHKSFQAEQRSDRAIWIVGPTGSGKTARLIQQFQAWTGGAGANQPACLFFAASSSNRLLLTERLTQVAQGHNFSTVTPISFFQGEVMQFWPLLQQQLGLKAGQPLRLHPETEQDLAARLWQAELSSGKLRQPGVKDALAVQHTLELLRLAAANGTPHEQIPLVLQQGMPEPTDSPERWDCMGEALNRWWQWCLERGLLTYAIITELYWRYLLPHASYQQQLSRRYRAVLVDDIDEYPAISRTLFEFFLAQSIPTAFTFNPNGAIRLGLGADPDYVAGLAEQCALATLPPAPTSQSATWGQVIAECIRNPLMLPQLPDSIQVIQTVSKAQLLRQTAELIATAIQQGDIQPQDIAIIAPGIDAITRYTLQEILSSKGIALHCLNLQQPLIRSAVVRALLTLMAVVYPGLGRLVDRESVAEMLVVLSHLGGPKPRIDPVRAGLLADYCFVPDAETPRLLAATEFTRWDRLGYQATQAYSEILQWIVAQQQTSPSVLLDLAIQRFWADAINPDQLTLLQELMQAAQHYWEVETRLAQDNRSAQAATAAIGRFIELLRAGTITGNPQPDVPVPPNAVTLATIYQYRNQRAYHRWQFWLDAGSPLWLTGNVTLFGAPLFLHHRANRVWTAADALAANQDYLEREVLDLLDRATERIYLCHCDLAVNGQEQSGALMPLINAAVPVN